MDVIYLEKPSIKRQQDAIKYIGELRENNLPYSGTGYLERYINEYQLWLKLLKKYESPLTCPNDVCPGFTYFLIRKNDNKIIGMINIRTKLIDKVRLHGGNIGYSIRPSEQHKGYGKRILKLGLDKCKEIGMNTLTIVTNSENIASSKIIESCNGIMIDSVPSIEYNKQDDIIYQVILKKGC